MDRRKVLKKIGCGSAAIVVSPQIINMLHSCKSNVNEYSPFFFTGDQYQFVSKIMELIIPKTDIPGAIELKLPEFLDNYIVVVMNHSEREILLRGTERDAVERGQVLTKPGAINPHTKFEATVYVLSKEEGGRHTPFFKGYRPQFYVRTTDVTGAVELPDGVEMVMPGDNIDMTVELISPIAMEDGMNFAIREGGRTVGSGVVTKIID